MVKDSARNCKGASQGAGPWPAAIGAEGPCFLRRAGAPGSVAFRDHVESAIPVQKRGAFSHGRARPVKFHDMTKLLLVPTALGLFLTQAAAQARDTIVELPSDWQVGERHRIEMIKEREQYQGGNREFWGGSRTIVEVEILRKSEAGFVIRWTFGKAELRGAAKTDSLTAKMANLAAGMRLDVRTDALGSAVGLENLDEVMSHYRIATGTVIREIENMGVPETRIAQIRRSIAPLANPATVEALSLREPSLFHLVMGGTFQLGAAQEYEDLLPNPFGGRAFPGKAYFLLHDIKPQKNRAFIEWKQTIDPEKAGSIMLETLTAMAKRVNAPAPTEADLSAMIVEDAADYAVDTKTGWPVSVTHERTTSIGGRRRVDRLTFRRLPGG